MKVVFCSTFPITSKTKLMFILRLVLIFPFHEEVLSSEVTNRLKDSLLSFYHVMCLECILELVLLVKQITAVTILIFQQYYPVFPYVFYVSSQFLQKLDLFDLSST